MNTETEKLKNQSVIKRSAVKRYALYVAASSRAHKFTRVATTFLNDVEARVEMALRKLGAAPQAPIPAKEKFVTKVAVDKFKEVIEVHTRAIVCEKVRQQPSAGKTLV